MPKTRTIGQFAPGTWVQRQAWPLDQRACVALTRAELVSIVESVDPDACVAAQNSIGECFPVLVEVYGQSVTWSDEICVDDAVASDWQELSLAIDEPPTMPRRSTRPYKGT